MCVCPLHIKNNKLDFDPLVDRLYNYVPCGKCYECQESKRNSYEVRSLFEFIYTQRIGGCAYYVTLTYDNNNVRKLPNTDILVSSKQDITNFLKRFRKNLSDYSIKYHFVSEYGDKTFRPHYHGILYFDKPLYPDVFQKVIKKSWPLGFVAFGENKGLIKDSRVFSYVSKYVCKDSQFIKYINNLNDLSVKSYFNNDLEFRKKYSLYPFHINSQHFGLSIINYLKDIDYIRGYFVHTDSVGLNRKLAIPLYILRYALYDQKKNKNDSISYVLNNYGIKIFKLKLKYQYKKLTQKYDDLISLALKNPQDYYYCSPTAKRLFNIAGFTNYIKSLSVTGTSYIVAYKLLYHDIDYVDFTFKNFNEDIQIFVDSVYKKQWYQFSTCKKYLCPFADEVKLEVRMLEDMISWLRYKQYVIDVNNYNRNQFHKFLITKQIKLKPVLTYNEFINNVQSLKKYKCLITKENLNEKDLFPLDMLSHESFEISRMAV